MKKIFAITMLMMTSVAFSQTYDNSGTANYQQDAQFMQDRVPAAAQGMRHMFEFNIDSVEAAALSFDKIKTRGQDADNGTNINLSLNYAYGVTSILQVATRFNYFTGVQGSEDQENLDIAFGGIVNMMEDFTNSPYVSLFVGAGWAQQFGDNASRDDLRFATLSLGKRWNLDMFGLKHVTYSPEVSLKMLNSTTDESLDYSQSLQFKLLQFSIFF